MISLNPFQLIAGNPTGQVECLEGNTCDTGLPNVSAGAAQLDQILQILFAVLAVVSVLVIVLAGVRFIADADNPQETAKARKTIIYALAGLVIAISGQLIVVFVLDRIG